MRPITEPYYVTEISTVLPVLAHRKQRPVPFPPTELFGGERRIRRDPAVMKWRRIVFMFSTDQYKKAHHMRFSTAGYVCYT